MLWQSVTSLHVFCKTALSVPNLPLTVRRTRTAWRQHYSCLLLVLEQWSLSAFKWRYPKGTFSGSSFQDSILAARGLQTTWRPAACEAWLTWDRRADVVNGRGSSVYWLGVIAARKSPPAVWAPPLLKQTREEECNLSCAVSPFQHAIHYKEEDERVGVGEGGEYSRSLHKKTMDNAVNKVNRKWSKSDADCPFGWKHGCQQHVLTCRNNSGIMCSIFKSQHVSTHK